MMVSLDSAVKGLNAFFLIYEIVTLSLFFENFHEFQYDCCHVSLVIILGISMYLLVNVMGISMYVMIFGGISCVTWLFSEFPCIL